MRRKITVGDLPAQPGPGVVLKCPAPGCGAEYSAQRGDYFLEAPGLYQRCSCQGRPYLALVRKIVTYAYVPIVERSAKPADSERDRLGEAL